VTEMEEGVEFVTHNVIGEERGAKLGRKEGQNRSSYGMYVVNENITSPTLAR